MEQDKASPISLSSVTACTIQSKQYCRYHNYNFILIVNVGYSMDHGLPTTVDGENLNW